MGWLQASLIIICTAITTVLAAPAMPATNPTVTLDNGTFTGTTSNGVNKFLGIPFAQPPVGNLRFHLPQELDPYQGAHSATAFGPACPQQAVTPSLPAGLPQDVANEISNVIFSVIFPDSEDCLTLNVVTPSNAIQSANLPVVVWIYGGGFEVGSTSTYALSLLSHFIQDNEISSFDGGVIVQRSVALGKPVIYVSMNYRVSGTSAFGFLASQEVKDAGVGNLGLHDQRLALLWVQKHISKFGGDPTKVTIWGESAGSISVALQMLANDGNTEGLFRAAFMQSGSPTPIGDITHGQPYYDDLVERTGCSGSPDTLACLRTVPYATLKDAMNKSPSIFAYQSLALAWQPRVDGNFLSDNPQNSCKKARVSRVYNKFILPNATDEEIDRLLTLYPEDVTQGSPYDTGLLNAITPQYKRTAALFGDLVFQAPRRFFLQQRSETQDTWSFLSKRLKALPVLGSVHGSDLLNSYGLGELTDYLIRFATNLDPNGGLSPQWPRYTTASPQLLTFLDIPVPSTTITQDTYRADGIEFATKLSLAYPL
ncbi:carotenoid ester lipase precursor [Multifurca ochricompacta]|uniref:Carboxylic ester hydrolase n=1 Tax=Multifurca ochricompacta TaxID=376703 RepID=A0AAD4M1T6_9AGAM|nr:carotenoid ester lipase precursor [Multifurca ochricompacta]